MARYGVLGDERELLELLRRMDAGEPTKNEDAVLRRITKVNFSRLELTSLPESLFHLTSLQSLDVSGNHLTALPETLGNLTSLEWLNVSHNQLTVLPETLSNLTSLKELNVSHNQLTVLPEMLGNLTTLQVLWMQNNELTALPETSGNLMDLQWLDVSGNQLTMLPETLGNLTTLQKLWVYNNQLTVLPETLGNLRALQMLNISDNPLKEIPNWIGSFSHLRKLKLSDLSLHDIPAVIMRLGLDFQFDLDEWRKNDGINLFGTTIDGVDMSIFKQSREVILQWFEARERQKVLPEEDRAIPLKEIKVIFLGDGEAGKSRTIARLLKKGEQPENFDGEATPGIAIDTCDYSLPDGRRVQVHFWDFGGQEILHSMHRMFLTQHTLYVVFLNARDNTQDDRARYWLHNVKSFAKDAPILLVLNKMDQNPSATINESGLRTMYPKLTKHVCLSALKDSPEEFNEKFTAVLKQQIADLDILDSPLLPSWYRLKNELQTMKENYIRGTRYLQLCKECGIVGENMPRDLLRWFNDLGVSFCYEGNMQLEDYVILRPDWVTNAIYIILFNGRRFARNGIILRDEINQLLCPKPQERDSIKRVLKDVDYSVDETQYVLEVVHKFNLSYRMTSDAVKADREFVPMLCDANEPSIVQEYANDPEVQEYDIEYEYLPNTVMHRLMVRNHWELDTENVWLTGGRFVQASNHVSAVVKGDGNTLRVYLRREEEKARLDIYWNNLYTLIENINKDLELDLTKISVFVIYKADGIEESFDYEDLIGSLACGIKERYSRKRKRAILIEDILRHTDYAIKKEEKKLFDDILSACQLMQDDLTYYEVKEDQRNTNIRNLLLSRGYNVSDQSLGGMGKREKQAGERDIVIRRKTGELWTIYEALNIKGKNDTNLSYWDTHLKKLLGNYNANGLSFLFLTCYVECTKEKFIDFWTYYLEHMRTAAPEGYVIERIVPFNTLNLPNFIKATECIYDCNGTWTAVYHIFARMAR